MSIAVIAVLLSGTCVLVSNAVFRYIMNDEYIITADSMAATVAAVVDGDRIQVITDKVMELYHASDNKLDNTQWDNPEFDAYAEQFLPLMQESSYMEIRSILRKIQNVSEADCIYTLCICPEEKNAVYIVDAAYGEEIVTPGCFDLVEESCYPYLNDLSQGFPAFITKTPEYGWIVTSCAPIYNSNNEIVCFAAVDLSMNEVLATENHFLLLLTSVLIFFILLICVLSVSYVKKKIIVPIRLLSEAAGQYSRKQIKRIHHEFSSLDIHTGDELEILLKSMVQMEQDIDSYIQNLTQTQKQLDTAKQHADNLQELAHMDSMTGIRNRLAYDKEIVRLDEELRNGQQACGIAMIDLNFLKRINDTYGHEYGNVAIISLSRMICDIFAHSPVFRIGGDEFAVILKNHDFERIEDLSGEFSRRLAELAADESLQPWEKISAAFGYALFCPGTDRCAEDIFRRADKNMYEHKKAMKASRI